MEILENGLQPHSGASSQSCRSADADACCKRDFIARIRQKFGLPITLIRSFSMKETKRQIFQFPRYCLHYFHKNIIEYEKFPVYVIINKKAFQSNANCPLDNRMGFIMNKFEHDQRSPY